MASFTRLIALHVNMVQSNLYQAPASEWQNLAHRPHHIASRQGTHLQRGSKPGSPRRGNHKHTPTRPRSFLPPSTWALARYPPQLSLVNMSSNTHNSHHLRPQSTSYNPDTRDEIATPIPPLGAFPVSPDKHAHTCPDNHSGWLVRWRCRGVQRPDKDKQPRTKNKRRIVLRPPPPSPHPSIPTFPPLTTYLSGSKLKYIHTTPPSHMQQVSLKCRQKHTHTPRPEPSRSSTASETGK